MGYTGEQKREYQRNWLSNRRKEWIDSQGGVCAECGSTENLEVDHKDKNTKTHPVATLWSRSKHIRDAELKKCQVLCEDCHKVKSANEAAKKQHGTINMYERHGCRCIECKQSKANKNRLRYLRGSEEAL